MPNCLSLKRVVALLVIVTFALPLSAFAERRRDTPEFYFAPSWFSSETVKLDNGARVDFDNDMGWRIGFGYNFNKNFELSGDFGWAYPGFKITKTGDFDSDPLTPDTTAEYKGKSDIFDGHLNGTYNFIKGPVTPFVTGGLGYTYVDSRIPAGRPTTGCWYDPWYGYVCDTYQATYADTFFSYKAGVGVRWDVNDSFFLKGTYGRTWIDFDNTTNHPSFQSGALDIGFMF